MSKPLAGAFVFGSILICVVIVVATFRHGPEPENAASAPSVTERPLVAEHDGARSRIDVAVTPLSREALAEKPQPEPEPKTVKVSAPAPVQDVDLPEDTIEQVEKKISALRGRYDSESAGPLLERFKANLTTKISDELTYSGSPEDRTDVYNTTMVPGQGTYRTVLPREQFVDLYSLKAVIVKLEDKRRDLKFAAVQQPR